MLSIVATPGDRLLGTDMPNFRLPMTVNKDSAAATLGGLGAI